VGGVLGRYVFDYIPFSKFHTHNGDDTLPRVLEEANIGNSLLDYNYNSSVVTFITPSTRSCILCRFHMVCNTEGNLTALFISGTIEQITTISDTVKPAQAV